ncbi:hypothetical protein NEOLEDRAFT_1150812 [Neolentinus lepideus HHB14362 ss-1]|uniref:Uncharacterized protein n=1 Tax=Neolentinus lepideus HHB14362 ss-1 TaxID=1314782 RepID=A0A165PMH9_9AGAM|nr:hypothetical protein NEOLEDRAFT_1150812 [Neolentinus lepideus HHB14362 ss-1]
MSKSDFTCNIFLGDLYHPRLCEYQCSGTCCLLRDTLPPSKLVIHIMASGKSRGKSKATPANVGNPPLAAGSNQNPTATPQNPVDATILEELAKLKEQLEAEKQAQEAAEWRAAAAAVASSTGSGQQTTPQSCEPIPKPKGSARQGFCLIEVMGLQNDEEQYNTILHDVRDLIHGVKLNWAVDYREQPMQDLGNLFAVACDMHPILANFKNDWATSEIVIGHIKPEENNQAAPPSATNETTRPQPKKRHRVHNEDEVSRNERVEG